MPENKTKTEETSNPDIAGDVRIAELEAHVKTLEEGLANANKALLEAETNAKKRATTDAEELAGLTKELGELKKKLKSKGSDLPEGDFVRFQGEIHPIIGDFRADNTFVEVKKSNCPEGVTLIAIAKPH